MGKSAEAGHPIPADRYVSVGGARLFVRERGAGTPTIVLHGGPAFDHTYLLPELDRLSDLCHLVYYDQRGRGRSATDVHADDVSIDSEMADLDDVRRFLGLGSVAVLGHSWGGLLAMEYAVRRPECVSHLILMNTAPPSHHGYQRFREHLAAAADPDDVESMRALAADPRLEAGDLQVEAEYNRLYFRATVGSPASLEALVARLRTHFDEAGVRTSRAIGERLFEQTWLGAGYDLTPALATLDMPTLVLHAEHDFIPIEPVAQIAATIPGARLVVLERCGHFAYVERPDEVCAHIAAFFAGD